MKRAFTILYIICMLSLSACKAGGIYTNYKEVEQLQLVRIMGFDRADNGEQQLTVASGKAAASGPSALLSISAPSITLCTERLHDYAASKLLFYDHSQCILIGEVCARQGVAEYLSYVERSTEMRTSMDLFVVKGDTARALMSGSKDESYDISQVMDSVQRDMRLRGDTHAFSCGETARALSEHGAALVCALMPTNTKDIVASVDAGTTAIPKGFGILKDGVLVDFLDEAQAQAACLVMETGELSTMTLRDRGGGIATVVLESCRCEIQPQWEGERLSRVQVRLTVDAALSELSEARQLDDSTFLDDLGHRLAQELSRRCEILLDKSREHEADFLGLGRKLRAKDPKAFDRLDTSWPGQTEFAVSVSASVGRAGDLGNTASSEGGGMLSVPAQ